MDEYQIIKVIGEIEESGKTLGKYGLYLSGYTDGRYRIEVDNTEYLVPIKDIEAVDDSFIVFDLEQTRDHKGWTIRTPNCKIGINKEEILCDCFYEELFIFPSFAAAQQYIEENFQIVQIGKINADPDKEYTL